MTWGKRLFRRRQIERELDSELRFHFESQVADKMQAGTSEAEARRAASIEFGGLQQVKEDCRESRRTRWLSSILQDLRFGARILIKSPGFSLTAILVLTLGIGVGLLAFSLYDLVSLQSLPVRDPATLVSLQRRSPENIVPGIPHASISYYRENAKSLSAVMETMSGPPMVLDRNEKRVTPSFVSANYFTELGASVEVGRLLDPARDDSSNSEAVAVLSYRLWQRRFDGSPSVIGKTISLGGRSVTVVGVAAKRFANLGMEYPDLWLPLQQYAYVVEGSRPLNDPKFDGMILMWGRLATGVTSTTAEQELLGLTNQLRKQYPTVIWDHERILVSSGAHLLSVEDGTPLLAIGALLVTLILTVACANLGGLLLARGVGRRREIQLRMSLGAPRSRIFRQLVTESMLLGMLGSLAALPLSYGVLRLALSYADAPAWMNAPPDWRVILFTVAMGLVASIAFGSLPALQISRQRKGRAFGQQFVVCAQVGASCLLLILASLLVRAALHLVYSDPGFGYEQVIAIEPGLKDHGYTPANARAYLDELQNRLRSVPGVISVSMAWSPPLVNSSVSLTSIDVDGRRVVIYPNWVGPDFFETMGIPLLRGRYLHAGETQAVVLSESLARRRWPNVDPIGKQWKNGKDVVVGVVGNTRAMEINNTDATEMYASPSEDNLPAMSVLVKTVGAPEGLTPAVKGIAGSIDPKLFPLITTLKAGFRSKVVQLKQAVAIIGMLGSVATFLALVGLLGLVSYAVSQQTKELAIRLALGASRTEIFSPVLRRFVWPVSVGLVAGAGIALGVSQIIRRVLYGLSGVDAISYLSAIGLLMAILSTAALLPIRRALRLDIARILHSD